MLRGECGYSVFQDRVGLNEARDTSLKEAFLVENA